MAEKRNARRVLVRKPAAIRRLERPKQKKGELY
jgi:hypothetical protein